MDEQKKNPNPKPTSENAPSAPVAKRPASAVKKRPPAKKTISQKKINPTAQSLVGIFVFAMGLALTIAVLYLAYTKFFASPTLIDPAALQDSANKNDSADTVKNIDKADLKNMYGQWAVRYGYLTAYVTFSESQTFQITLFMDEEGYERRVTSGSFTYDDKEGILVLKPSYERLPKPEFGVLKTLTRNKFSIVALMSKKDGDLIWVPYNARGNRSSIHPLFTHLDRDESFIRWSRTK